MNSVQFAGKCYNITDGKGGVDSVRFRLGVLSPGSEKKKPEMTFFSVVAFGPLAKRARRIKEKETYVSITGRYDKTKYKDNDGNEKERDQIVAYGISFDTSTAKPSEYSKAKASEDAGVTPDDFTPDNADDIPY